MPDKLDKLSIGFYAPMKSPSHAVASGDRQVARGFMEALRRAGFAPLSVSDERCYLGDAGDSALANLREVMDNEFERLRNLWEADSSLRPRLLFAYHVYHKSPDLLLHRLADYFGLPYVVAEASYARRQRGGRYDEALSLSAEALLRADVILQLNSDDMQGVQDLLSKAGVAGRQILMRPFMDVGAYRHASGKGTLPDGWGDEECIFMAHGMMRHGDKFRSYEVLAEAFRVLSGCDNWRLVIIGGGEAESEVQHLFTDFGDRVYFTGLLNQGDIVDWLDLSDIYVWPAIGEAFGMGILEAVALGLPIIAGDRSGVRGIVDDGKGGILCREGDIELFQKAILHLYQDYFNGGNSLRSFADYNWQKGMTEHDISIAASFFLKLCASAPLK